MIRFIINEKGSEVISERHQKDFKNHHATYNQEVKEVQKKTSEIKNFTNINFEDI